MFKFLSTKGLKTKVFKVPWFAHSQPSVHLVSVHLSSSFIRTLKPNTLYSSHLLTFQYPGFCHILVIIETSFVTSLLCQMCFFIIFFKLSKINSKVLFKSLTTLHKSCFFFGSVFYLLYILNTRLICDVISSINDTIFPKINVSQCYDIINIPFKIDFLGTLKVYQIAFLHLLFGQKKFSVGLWNSPVYDVICHL